MVEFPEWSRLALIVSVRAVHVLSPLHLTAAAPLTLIAMAPTFFSKQLILNISPLMKRRTDKAEAVSHQTDKEPGRMKLEAQ
jgi:hypothetical protein